MQETFKSRSLGQSYDWKLIGIYLALVFFGLANIYASIHSSEPSSVFDLSARSGMQCIWIASSLVLAILILFVLPGRIWESVTIPAYIFVLFLLVAVIFMGVEVKGSRSWFNFGAVRFQPAEISKITTSLMLAFIMSRPGFRISKLNNLIKVGAVIALPMLIIMAESETGSALVYAGFLFVLYREGFSGWFLTFLGVIILLFILTLTASPFAAMVTLLAILLLLNCFRDGIRISSALYVLGIILFAAFLPKICSLAGLQVKPSYILAGLLAASIPIGLWFAYKKKNAFLMYSAGALAAGLMLIFSTDIIFNSVLQEHQRKRIEVLLGMKEDPSGVGYNVNQSMIAIGSGGLTGKGYLNGTQTTYGFVPEQSTDFIFCTVGEEWGFFGSLAVIGLYVMLIWRIIHDAERSREHFTRIYGYCVAACLFMHLFINIGMTIGLMPVIGIPLPMMSYGGSSLWAFTILIFIFVALDHQEKKYF